MATRPKIDYKALDALETIAVSAMQKVAEGSSDDLIVPMNACPVIPGEQTEDGVRAIAAIDVVRYFVDNYEATVLNDSSMAAWPKTDEERDSFADWQDDVAQNNTTLGWRHWLVSRDQE